MALERSARPLCRHIRSNHHLNLPIRTLATTTDTSTTSSQPPPPPSSTRPPNPSPERVHTPRSERRLLQIKGQYPIGSRRRRAALASTTKIPFTQLPYQCFQEARKVLATDREEKVEEIKRIRERIAQVESMGDGVREEHQGEEGRKKREDIQRVLRQNLDKQQILADINDPVVKKRHEDGMGDMTKPIYRHLAHLEWMNYRQKILMQRITQMNVIPDVLPNIDPSVSTILRFGRKKIPHGIIVPSQISEQPPSLTIQPYDAGERLVTIAVVNPDVPDVENDKFGYRCHFLAANVPISPTQTEVDLGSLNTDSQVIVPWLPAYAQKGLPYQRMSIFVLEQHPPGAASELGAGKLDVAKLRQEGRFTEREGFILRSFVHKQKLKPVGVDLFRTVWDEGTAGVMRRAGLVGGDVEFKRKRIEPLPYKRLKSERFR